MAYTIIEVERKTGVSSRRIRFWCDKGLFPFVQKDSNNVRYFSQSDIEWVQWIECYRKIGMSIKHLKEYIYLASLGTVTLQKRLDIIKNTKQKVLKDMAYLNDALTKLDYKIEYYNNLISSGKDELNPQSKDYINVNNLRQKAQNKAQKSKPIAKNPSKVL